MKETMAFFTGFIGMALLLITLGLSPKQQVQQHRNEAVSAGVAEWIVSYDSNGSPVLEFRWKIENQKL